MGNNLSGPMGDAGDAGDAHRRDNGTGNPQNSWDYLRYLCCSSCSRLDEPTGSQADTGSPRSSNSTADERRRLLTGEEPTGSQADTESDRSSDQRSEHSRTESPLRLQTDNNRRGVDVGPHSQGEILNTTDASIDREGLNQRFQVAKRKIEGYLDEKQKGTFEKIADHLSKWITNAEEGIEMNYVSGLVKNLDEMKFDSDLVKNLGEMRATIVLLDSRKKLNQTFQAAKKRIDDYLVENPDFLNEGQKEAYKIAVDNLSEHMKNGELGIEMNDHISNLVEILNKIPNIRDAKKSKGAEQCVTDEYAFGRMRKELNELDGCDFEEMRQKIEEQKEDEMDKGKFMEKFERMIEEMDKDEKNINEKLEEFDGEFDEDNITKAQEKLESLKKAKEATRDILKDITSGRMNLGEVGFDSRMILISDYIKRRQREEFEEMRQEIKEQKEDKMGKGKFMEKYTEMIRKMIKDEKDVNEKLKGFDGKDDKGNIAKAKEKLDNLKKAKEAARDILKDIASGRMKFGKIGEFDSHMRSISDYIKEGMIEEFERKNEKDNKRQDYCAHGGEGDGWYVIAHEFILKWKPEKPGKPGKQEETEEITKIPKEDVLELFKEDVLELFKAVPDTEMRQEIWEQCKSEGLDMSIDPITGREIREISKPQPSSSASGTQVVRPRRIQFSEDRPR